MGKMNRGNTIPFGNGDRHVISERRDLPQRAAAATDVPPTTADSLTIADLRAAQVIASMRGDATPTVLQSTPHLALVGRPVRRIVSLQDYRRVVR
jgi:hypothetical protein